MRNGGRSRQSVARNQAVEFGFGVPERRLMSKIVANIADRSTGFFPVAIVGMGLVATMLWAGTLVLVAVDGAWSILSAI
jgi:hypothetical protein